MRYQRMVAGLGLAAIAFFSACAENTERSPAVGPQSETDVAAIRGLFDRYDSTATDGLAEEWMSLLSDDIIWMVPNQAALVGKDAVLGRVGPSGMRTTQPSEQPGPFWDSSNQNAT